MNLLIVDDDEVTVKVLKERTDRNHLIFEHIYTAYDVESARKILQGNNIEMVLCDIEMPRENGLELLEWVRKEQMDIEFLFLTSHEKFEYAFGAVKNQAANYLLKPVDIPVIYKALLETAEKIKKRKHLSQVEEFWNYGKKRVIREFWRNLMIGEGNVDESEAEKEMQRLGIRNPESGEQYIMVFCHLRREAIFLEKENGALNQFILDNLMAEILTKGIEMERIVHWEDGGEYYIEAVCDGTAEETKKKVQALVGILNRFYPDCVEVIYLAMAESLARIREITGDMQSYDRSHVFNSGEIIHFSQREKDVEAKTEKLLDQKLIFHCLENRERLRLLEYLQKVFLSSAKKERSLKDIRLFRMDLIQTVSAFFFEQGRNLQFLFEDPVYVELENKNIVSEIDVIRWNAFFVNKIFDNMDQEKRSDELADIIVGYIREHYAENITRNTIAEFTHFSPEYVGKTFKRKMGMNINEYLNQYRVEQAKRLMQTTEYKITEIALMVGFENMPYFSSVFKKYEGISPAKYRKR